MKFSGSDSSRMVAAVLMASRLAAGQPNSPAQQAFDSYVAKVERRIGYQHARAETYIGVLHASADKRTAVARELRSGTMLIEPVDAGVRRVKGGLLHHWRGAAFVPGARANDMLTLLR